MSSSTFASELAAVSAELPFSLDELREQLAAEGFVNYGFAELTTPFSIGLYEDWLDRGQNADMSYLQKHLDEKRVPQMLLAQARSAIVVTIDYVPHPAPRAKWPLSDSTPVAAYAKGRDYHYFLRERMTRVIAWMQERAPNEEFRYFADSSPVLERDLAARADLGWIGKNSCLISRSEGSMFFLAEIYTTLQFPVAKAEMRDFCGTCTRCLDACPTGALLSPRNLDARRCISYWTIEAKDPAPEELRSKFGTWLFGCDICQTVCPWNKKVFGEQIETKSERNKLLNDLRYLLTAPNREIERTFAGTPLTRPGGAGLKRNALIVAANANAVELRAEITALLASEKQAELAAWTLAQLHDPISPAE